MLHLLWSILNIGIFIFFIAVSVRATKLVREKMGVFAAIVLVFGLLSFISRKADAPNLEPGGSSLGTWRFVSDISAYTNDIKKINIVFDNNIISKSVVTVVYNKDPQSGLYKPLEANTHINGLVAGTRWIPLSVQVSPTAVPKEFTYEVIGVVEWKLLGTTIISQAKEWTGKFEIR